MLVIRLSRTGRNNLPAYSIVVMEKIHSPLTGKFLEKLGYFSPLGEKPSLTYDKEKLLGWVKKGARPSETLARMLHKEGVPGMDKFYDTKKKFLKKEEPAAYVPPAAPEAAPEVAPEATPVVSAEAAPSAPAEAPVEVSTETPAA